jgi:arginine repressor
MVAITLDACQYPEIVGTVAGDDTIFIALRDPADRPAVEAILLNKASVAMVADEAHGDR